MQRISLAVRGARRGRGGVTAARWGGVGVWRESSGAGEDHEKQRLKFSHYCCASSSRWRQPTAVMRAAPLPLPSSDSRKLTSHFGASSFTVCWKILEKLRVENDRKLPLEEHGWRQLPVSMNLLTDLEFYSVQQQYCDTIFCTSDVTHHNRQIQYLNSSPPTHRRRLLYVDN